MSEMDVTGEVVNVSEKMLPQSEVDKIAGRLKAESYQKGFAAGQADLNREQIDQIINDRIEKQKAIYIEQARKAEAHNLASTFLQRVEAEKKNYPEIEDKLNEIGIIENKELVKLIADHPDMSDIIYDLADNPQKVVSIVSAVSSGREGTAKSMISKLSSSIKDNKRAAQTALPKDPLSQLKPSTAIPGDSGKMSVSDFRKQSWLRR